MAIKEPKGRLSKPPQKAKPMPSTVALLQNHYLQCSEIAAKVATGNQRILCADELFRIIGDDALMMRAFKTAALSQSTQSGVVSLATTILAHMHHAVDEWLNPSQTRSDADAAD